MQHFVLILIQLHGAKHSASPGWNCLQTVDFATTHDLELNACAPIRLRSP